MSAIREQRFRLEWSQYADWQILDQSGDIAHVHSNAAGTHAYVKFDSLIAADRDMTSPMFLAVADPEPRTATGSALSAPRTTSPGTGGQPLARNTDPQTAHDAANVARTTAAANRMRVLIAHRNAPDGLTGDELAQATGEPYAVIGPRRPGLVADGLLEATDMRRPSNRGIAQQVFRITEAGRVVADRAVA